MNERDAYRLLNAFLRKDEHYLASSNAYGDRGSAALSSALRMFEKRNDLGFVWLAYEGERPVAVCVVSYAISTSIGGLVAKLDDVYVESSRQRSGIATEMLKQLAEYLKKKGCRRIDTSVYSANRAGEAFYERLGFRPLGEERLAWVL